MKVKKCFFFNCCYFSVAKSCPVLCNSRNCSIPGFPVLHFILELAQTQAHWVDDAIQSSHLLPPPSPLALKNTQHQGLFHWVGSLPQMAKLLSSVKVLTGNSTILVREKCETLSHLWSQSHGCWVDYNAESLMELENVCVFWEGELKKWCYYTTWTWNMEIVCMWQEVTQADKVKGCSQHDVCGWNIVSEAVRIQIKVDPV